MNKKNGVKRIRILFRLAVCSSLLFTLVGCEALVRKFTRKPKQTEQTEVEMVVVPQEYQRPQVSNEEQYREYFLFLKSWLDELIDSLSSATNQKKYLSCIDGALKSLSDIRSLLKPEKQVQLDTYLSRFQQLKAGIINDIYGFNSNSFRYEAERLRRDMLRYFSYSSIKDYLQ